MQKGVCSDRTGPFFYITVILNAGRRSISIDAVSAA
jgi:hypothetical protein